MTIHDIPQSHMATFLEQMHRELNPRDREQWISKLVQHASECDRQPAWFGRMASISKGIGVFAYSTIYPGKLGVLTGPNLQGVDAVKEETAELVRHVRITMVRDLLRTSKAAGADIVQSVLDEFSTELQDVLSSSGMKRLASLLHFQAWIDRIGSTEESTIGDQEGSFARGEYTWETYQKVDHARWIELIESTYEQTLDCPELNGIRNTEDTWQGYLASAEQDLNEWWMLRRGNDDVGCMMLNKQMPSYWELTYMGVRPSFRGRGLGKVLMDQAFQRARLSGTEVIGLSADERNLPAIELYSHYGFHVERSMEAWFWSPKFDELE